MRSKGIKEEGASDGAFGVPNATLCVVDKVVFTTNAQEMILPWNRTMDLRPHQGLDARKRNDNQLLLVTPMLGCSVCRVWLI